MRSRRGRQLMIDGVDLTPQGYDVNEPTDDPAWGWSYRQPRRARPRG
jgi:hypothetical protein